MMAKRTEMNTLIENARRLGKHKTKKEALRVALEEYVRHHQGLRALELCGTVDYYPDYDYKKARRQRHIEYSKTK